MTELSVDVVAMVERTAALELEVNRLKGLLARSIRAIDTGDGWRLVMGDDPISEVVLDWKGDGIAADTVFHREPTLEYFVRTTAHHRCLRILVEHWSWPIACALITGLAGQGDMMPSFEYDEDLFTGKWADLREAAHEFIHEAGAFLAGSSGIQRVQEVADSLRAALQTVEL